MAYKTARTNISERCAFLVKKIYLSQKKSKSRCLVNIEIELENKAENEKEKEE